MVKMNKQEVEVELEKTIIAFKKEKENNGFLLKQQNKFRKMAERAGSEAFAYKTVVERLKDELETLDATLKNIVGDTK